MNTKIILSIKNLTKEYKTKHTTVRALDNVSLDIYEAEVLCLLGVNGAGKTTLSSILATLHPPTSGDVEFNGISIYKNLGYYRRSLGFCPQKQNLDPFLTVRENLVFAGRYFLIPEDETQKRTDEILSQLELTRYKNFKIDALSGGTQQRLLIARALMHKPRIVILDEPTVGLDPDIRRKLWDLIAELKVQGITVIITTHYLDEAEYLSDRVCLLHKGELRLVESVETLKEKHGHSTLEEVFLTILKEYNEEL
ncbi:MAG TPA: ABC transporter ATP-binding protein [Candidatus Babeliales bacterium]|jgi:ABC-type multidrug transport system ATPase subunit|nr:ABC transporter ATP-binding protein [Candidatus Babeliales bacterium]